MEQITVKLPDDTAELLEDVAESQFDGNRSEAVRELLRRGTEYDDLKRENERLQQQLAATNRRVDQHTELVEYVREEREIQRSRQSLEERKAKAGVLTRAKWWLVGMSDENENEN